MRTLWTIGHSIRPWDAFVAMLREAEIAAVADVRRFPGSRRHPQYSAEAMAQALPAMDIDYLPMPELGGRRRPRPDSSNTAWRSDAFRGYADYMQTQAYVAARDRLMDVAAARRTAVLCAEAVWWRCHRALISDDLKAHGWQVIHLSALGRSEEHPFTSAAHIDDTGRLDYAAASALQSELFEPPRANDRGR
jgi:uncharacterized protein (DUF488 family)